jgi:hypothetical protein
MRGSKGGMGRSIRRMLSRQSFSKLTSLMLTAVARFRQWIHFYQRSADVVVEPDLFVIIDM